ncbi:unnamed protein product, partial [Scytosiphon promiscuus]
TGVFLPSNVGTEFNGIMKVIFVHLDLGIGGAEMLVVNAAVAAKRAGHEVVVYTSHHDETRCFKETKKEGVLGGRIRVRGDWLPRHLLFGRFTALCAVARMLWLALCVVASEAVSTRGSREPEPSSSVKPSDGGGGCGARGRKGDKSSRQGEREGRDDAGNTAAEGAAAAGSSSSSAAAPADARTVIFCDGVSAPVPLLRLAGPVLFYCHFPDKLLCVRRGSFLKRAYRWPLDMLEEATTASASSVAVNSNFTAGIFREAFPRLGRAFLPAAELGRGSDEGAGSERPAGTAEGVTPRLLRVLYPPTDVDAYAEREHDDPSPAAIMGPVVSLNRFERKKNLPLAVEALGWVAEEIGAEEAASRGLRLVIAGGYDKRVPENVDHLMELQARASNLGLEGLVEFRTNIPDDERSDLLGRASCVLYTPSHEHFGIVPVEAMCCGAPVVAVKSGEAFRSPSLIDRPLTISTTPAEGSRLCTRAQSIAFFLSRGTAAFTTLPFFSSRLRVVLPDSALLPTHHQNTLCPPSRPTESSTYMRHTLGNVPQAFTFARHEPSSTSPSPLFLLQGARSRPSSTRAQVSYAIPHRR